MAIEWSATLKRGALAAAMIVGLAAPAFAAPVKTSHLELELFAGGSAAPGKTVTIGLRQTIAPGWHTYWRNPGDAGEATQIDWTLPKSWTAGPILWPTPSRALTGPLMNYVYSDTVVLPSQLRVADDAKPGARVTVKAHASLLVCKDVCVPEDANLSLDLPVTASPTTDAGAAAAIGVALRHVPDKAAGEAKAWLAGDRLTLSVQSPDLVKAAKKAAEGEIYFYPFSGTVIDHAKAQTAKVQGDSLRLTLPAGYDFTHGKAPARLAGVVALGGKGLEIDASVGPEPAQATAAPAEAPSAETAPTVAPPPPSEAAAAPVKTSPASPPVDPLGLPAAVALAFLGGLILNLMPCVFPVLSIKAAALSRHGQHAGAAKAEGLAYLAGVVLTFLALAAALIAARRAGEAVGWGFQLQSPVTVSVLTLVMLASALNLSGLFEFGLSAQGTGADLAAKPGLAGAFFTGVLAVVVAGSTLHRSLHGLDHRLGAGSARDRRAVGVRQPWPWPRLPLRRAGLCAEAAGPAAQARRVDVGPAQGARLSDVRRGGLARMGVRCTERDRRRAGPLRLGPVAGLRPVALGRQPARRRTARHGGGRRGPDRLDRSLVLRPEGVEDANRRSVHKFGRRGLEPRPCR